MNVKSIVPGAARVGEIENRMCALESRAEALAARLRELDQRLEPVLRPDEPLKGGEDAPVYQTHLARRLDALNDSFGRSLDALENTISRLDL